MQGRGRFCGWSLIETTGAASAIIELYDGMDATGQLIAVADLGAAGTIPPVLDNDGVSLDRGLFLNVLGGTVRGAMWVRYL